LTFDQILKPTKVRKNSYLLTVKKLSEAILEVTKNQVIQQNAASLSKNIRAEHGIKNAIAIIEGFY